MKATTNGTAGAATGHGGRARRIAGIAAAALLTLLAACDSAEERAQGHYETALELIEQGNTVKAQIELRNAIRLDDSLAGAYFQLGKLQQAEGQLSQAAGRFRRASDLDETMTEAHLRYGQIMLAAGKIDEALEASITAFQLAPRDVDVLVLKASTAVALENFESALSTIDDGLAIDDGVADFWLLRAAIAREEGDEDRALEIVREGLARSPESVALAVLEIDILARSGRLEEVGTAIEGLIERNPDEIAFREAQVRLHLSQRRFDEAEDGLRELAEMRPDEPARSLDIVRLVLRTRGPEVALSELNRMVEEAGTPVKAWPFNAAKVHFFAGRSELDKAEAVLREQIEALDGTEEGRTAALMLARMELARGNEAETEALLEQILAGDPGNTDALALRGRIAVTRGDYRAAINDLREAVQNSPDSVEALHVLAAALQRNGNPALAGERLADAVEVSDYAPRSSLLYAQFLVSSGKTDFATSLIETSIRKNPDSRELLEMLAKLRLQQQDWVGAEEVGQALRALDQNSETADQIVAAALTAQDRLDESISLLRDKDVEKATTGSQLASLIATFIEADRLDEAKEFLDTALTENPENGEVLRLKGVLAEREGDISGARTLFRQAISVAPDDPRTHGALARHLLRSGDETEAEAVALAGIEAVPAPRNQGLMMVVASLMEQRGAIDEAIAVYQDMAAREPVSPLVANNLASLLSDNNPTPEMIEQAYTLAKRLRGSEVPFFRDTYGWLLHLRGESEAALGVLTEAAQALPDNPVVHYHVGAVQAALGRNEVARETLQRAIELGADTSLPQMEQARTLLASLPEQQSGSE